MTYKRFVEWCNERACNGHWNMGIALACDDIMKKINKLPPWRREEEWQKLYKADKLKGLINEWEQNKYSNHIVNQYKDLDEYTLEDAVQGYSEGSCCICSDGKPYCVTNYVDLV